MRVAITINTSWNIFNFRSGLIHSLLAAGHEVFAIAPLDDYSGRLQQMGCQYIEIQMNNTGSNPIQDLILVFQLKKIYKEISPDIIYHYTIKPNIYGSIAAKQLGIPVINNVSGLGTVFLNKGISSTIAKQLYKWAFKNINLVFFQNEDDRRDFLSQVTLPNLNTDVLPGSGINLDKYKSSRVTPKNKTFLMIARLIIDKGVIEYLEAAKKIKEDYPEVKFQLLGQLDELHARGIKLNEIQQSVDQGTIDYLGETENVIPHIDHATCIVLPSYREGTPKTLLEGAAMSKPLITTNVPGCREVVQHQHNGLLCKVKDSESLVNAMIKLIELKESHLIEWGENSRELVEQKFDETIIINQYMTHSQDILSKTNNEY
ncbi:MAG: glycosyltransferase family 4 protein [Reichenbachiella sp.]